MERLQIKKSSNEKTAWITQSKKEGYISLAAWMRDVLNHQCDVKPITKLQGSGTYKRE